jgi:hypothetical protein
MILFAAKEPKYNRCHILEERNHTATKSGASFPLFLSVGSWNAKSGAWSSGLRIYGYGIKQIQCAKLT